MTRLLVQWALAGVLTLFVVFDAASLVAAASLDPQHLGLAPLGWLARIACVLGVLLLHRRGRRQGASWLTAVVALGTLVVCSPLGLEPGSQSPRFDLAGVLLLLAGASAALDWRRRPR